MLRAVSRSSSSAPIAVTALPFAPDTVSADTPVTLTGANIVDSVLRTGLTAARADTTPTAALLFAAVSGAIAGQTFQFTYVNTTGFAVTLTAGVGITFAGTSGGTTDVIAAGTQVVYQVSLTSGVAATITRKWAVQTPVPVKLAPDTISTDGSVTLSGANIVNGVQRTGLSDAAADVTPTATAIYAAVANAAPGQTFQFTFVNTTGFADTLTAGSGVTFSGTSGGSTDVIPANTEVVYQVSLTTSTTLTITRKWALAAGS